MHRREFITLVSSATAWPLAASAQQAGLPVLGYLRSGVRALDAKLEAAFRAGLSSTGYEEGKNLVIDYRQAESAYERVPALAADLVRRKVAVIYAGDNSAALASKAATGTIPVVFRTGADPVALGLVASMSRPGGNLTGVTFLTTTTEAIRLQMLHEAVPQAAHLGYLVNPANPAAPSRIAVVQEAARKLGVDLEAFSARNVEEIDAAFPAMAARSVQALAIDGDNLFNNRRQQIATLAARHTMPTIYATRDFPDAGGLMSYGADNLDADRLAGTYVGRILKGQKPSDLPVQQSTKVELIINMQTARAFGLNVPQTLLGRADEVIE
jgi:putative ABC transport system substrate-binding protein